MRAAKVQTSQIPSPFEWLGMHSYNFFMTEMTECSKTQIHLTGLIWSEWKIVMIIRNKHWEPKILYEGLEHVYSIFIHRIKCDYIIDTK